MHGKECAATFSIIVPVYNVAEYLSKCLESILPALKTDDEIILVLGESTDQSTELCYQFSEQHEEIKIIHQSGKGLSNARNCAIENASGDYIVCIDSDDYVDTKLFCELLNKIRSGCISEEVIAHDYYRFERKTSRMIPVFQIGDIPERVGMDFLPKMLHKRQCFWNVWRYIYHRRFIEKKRIIYRENMVSEDVDYTTSVLLAEPTIRFVHCPFYVYTVGRGDSLMDQPTLKRLSDTVAVLTDAITRLNTAEFIFASIVTAQFQFEYILNLALTVEIASEDRNVALELYKDWKQVLIPSIDPIVRLSALAMSVIGIRGAARGLHWLKLVRRWLRNNISTRRKNH